jgi:glycosyltransferase involved in cell wall biosynthesis
MRILWQNEHYPDAVKGGGSAVNTYYIVTALARLGHEVVILARGPAGRGAFNEDVNGTTVLRFPAATPPDGLWPVWPLIEPFYWRRPLTAVAGSFDAAVGIDYPFALGMKHLFPERPLIYRVEGSQKSHDAAMASGNGAPVSLAERKRRLVHRVLIAEIDFMDRRVWRRCDTVVVKSRFMRGELERLYGVPAERIAIVPNGVDHRRYAEAEATPDARERLGAAERERVVIVFCGRLVAMKNVGHLLRAVAMLPDRERVVLAILGDGDQRTTLQQEARDLGIHSTVRFLGHTERVEEYLAAADIAVLPSVYEPFGNALLEAMAAGLPCVALRPDGRGVKTASDEILDDGETGLLVDHEHPRALAEALQVLVSDRQRRRAMGQRAQQVCRARYSWESCAARYVELLVAARERRPMRRAG